MSDEVESQVQNNGIDSDEISDIGKLPAKTIPGGRGGFLYAGGVPGNKGGTGRPPNAIRAMYRELLGEYAEPTARAILDNPSPLKEHTKPAMLDHLAKYGLGEVQAVADDTVLKAVGTILANYLPEDILQQVFAEIEAAVKESV